VESADTLEPGSAEWWTSHARRLQRRRPRAGGLTIELIVDEAITLMDHAGLDGLTVRSLAGGLGTSSASLYRHVASVDELAVLAIDRVLGEVVFPDERLDGRERVVGLAIEFRRVLQAHPGVVPALRSAPLMGPNALRGVAYALDSLTAIGYSDDIAEPACLALIDYVLGSVFFDTAAAAAASGEPIMDSDQVFDLTIATFLDGLEHVHHPR
jgi:AcrR family transcriptional regulator